MTENQADKGKANRYYLTLDSYQFNPQYLDVPKALLGRGIDLRDPLKPLAAQNRAFHPDKLQFKGPLGLEKSSEIIGDGFTIKSCDTEQEESKVISAYFKANYGLQSLEGGISKSREERNGYHTIYALIEHKGEAAQIDWETPDWIFADDPIPEDYSDPDEELLRFVMGYGSHYISSILYGLRIGIQGKLSKKSSVDSTKLSTSFKAAFGSFGAEGGVSAEHIKKLQEMDVSIVLEATSGGHKGLLVVPGFEDITKFLDRIKKDEIEFSSGPMEITCRPYWSILKPEWKRASKLLKPSVPSFKVPNALYGVPQGTVIAWHPTPDFVKGLAGETKNAPEIIPPPGWALCDGTQGTPDLRDLFIRGTTVYSYQPITGGTATHKHGGLTGQPSGLWTKGSSLGSRYKGPTSAHTHAVTEDDHLPPYMELVYIMKLKETP